MMKWDLLTQEEKNLLKQDGITLEDVEESCNEDLVEFLAICLYGRDGTVELERRLENAIYTG